MSYRRPGEPRADNAVRWVMVYAVAVALLGLCAPLAVHVYQRREETRDMDRMQEVRVELGPIRNKLLYQLPKDSPERPQLERRAMELATEHNAILHRHPTWTVQPVPIDFYR